MSFSNPQITPLPCLEKNKLGLEKREWDLRTQLRTPCCSGWWKAACELHTSNCGEDKQGGWRQRQGPRVAGVAIARSGNPDPLVIGHNCYSGQSWHTTMMYGGKRKSGKKMSAMAKTGRLGLTCSNTNLMLNKGKNMFFRA